MPLWGKTDTLESAPKYLSDDVNAKPQVDLNNAYFVDITEAGVESNRVKGITTPGWNLVQDIGNGRLRVETLIAMKVSAEDAGDDGITGNTAIEDTVVADRMITILVQPEDSAAASGTPVSFAVSAAVEPVAALTFQWQIDTGSGFVNLVNFDVYSGVTTDTLAISDNTSLDGNEYRVIVSSVGADDAISDVATLTETA
jgi:hypothetical protein